MGTCASLPLGSPDAIPVDRVDLEGLIDQVFGSDGDGAPGVAVMVIHDGALIVQKQYGLANLEEGVPFTPNHIVRLPYSEGREFIAIAAALMEEDGLIRLDDAIRTYFPRLPAWSELVTFRDLILHRSGFVDEWSVVGLMHGSMTNRFDESQFLRLLYDQPTPEVEPGAGYMYSNSDYGLLRLGLERAAGEDLGAYMKRRMFEPLQMNATHLVDDFSAVLPHHTPFYAPDGDGYRYQEVKTSPGADYWVATSACDLAAWAEAHSDPTSEVSRAVARLMEGASTIPGRDGHYAFGQTVIDTGGVRFVRHEGVLEVNYLTRIPDLDASVITIRNGYYDVGENQAIVELLLGPAEDGEDTPPPPAPTFADAGDLARFTGRFVTTNVPSWESRTMARDLIRIETAGDTLVLDWPDWDRFPLVPTGSRTFAWRGEGDLWGMTLEFDDPDDDGPFELVIRYSDGYPAEEFQRLVAWTPAPALLQRVAGRYHSAHLDYTWTLMLDEADDLILRAPTMADISVEPYQEGEFLAELEEFPGVPYNVWIRFHENESGEITHLTAWNPRLMHHRFDRR